MMEPGPILTDGRSARWLERLRQFSVSNRILNGAGYMVNRTSQGTILRMLGTSGGGSVQIAPFQFLAFEGDTMLCYKFKIGSSDLETDTTEIALPFLLRTTNTKRTILGVPIIYSNYDLVNQKRTATRVSDGKTETQYITDQYVKGDIIFAVKTNPYILIPPANTSLRTGVDWIDMNFDGRYWAVP